MCYITIALSFIVLSFVQASITPSQVHIAYSGEVSGGYLKGLSFSWQTEEDTNTSVVLIGTSPTDLPIYVRGSSSKYWKTYHHHAVVSELQEESLFYYRVGDTATNTFSEIFSLTTESLTSSSLKVAVIGDMGVTYSQDVISSLKTIAEQKMANFLLHLGDISYADDSFLQSGSLLKFDYEHVWDRYMESMSPITSVMPYMTLPGNHEAECHSPACQANMDRYRSLSNFTAYNSRFNMPSVQSGGASNMWYSFNRGPVHFVQIDTETDFPDAPIDHYSWFGGINGGFGDQLKWLEADLKQAFADKQNGERPWIIVSGHRPLYSISETKDNADVNLRKNFESIFKQYQVDVYFCGHVHGYERSLPMANGKSSASGSDYSDPEDPVYIVNGAGGNIESFTKYYQKSTPEWNAYYNYNQWGYGMLEVTPSTLKWDFYSDKGAKLDSMSITKSNSPSTK